MKVLGLGDQVVDNYQHIKTMFPGGNALNFAVFSKKLGVDSAFLGAFGSDTAAKHVFNAITGLGVDASHSKHYEGENGCAHVSIIDGDRVFLGSNKCGVLREFGLQLNDEDYRYLSSFSLVHSSIYSFSKKEVAILHRMGVPVSFDFSDDFSEQVLSEVLPNIDYAFFSASHLSEEERRSLARRAIECGCKLVLCTCGSRGAYLYNANNEFFQEPHYVEATDTMAAGDAFITCFIVNYLKNEKNNNTINECLEKAAVFSSEQCLIQGSFGFGLKYE